MSTPTITISNGARDRLLAMFHDNLSRTDPTVAPDSAAAGERMAYQVAIDGLTHHDADFTLAALARVITDHAVAGDTPADMYARSISADADFNARAARTAQFAHDWIQARLHEARHIRTMVGSIYIGDEINYFAQDTKTKRVIYKKTDVHERYDSYRYTQQKVITMTLQEIATGIETTATYLENEDLPVVIGPRSTYKIDIVMPVGLWMLHYAHVYEDRDDRLAPLDAICAGLVTRYEASAYHYSQTGGILDPRLDPSLLGD